MVTPELGMKCKGEYCSGASVYKKLGKGSFDGWVLWICSHCGQIVHMIRAGAGATANRGEYAG